jgi:hypothetical protein
MHIQGPFITIFGRKTVASELMPVLTSLKGRVISGNSLEHNVCHTPEVLSDFWASEKYPHFHYTMPDKSIERGITDLITAIFEYGITQRKEVHQTLLNKMENDRIMAGDETVSKDVHDELAQMDTDSPFILSEDCQSLIQDILSKYSEYCQQRPSNDRCLELLKMYWYGPLIGVVSKVNLADYLPEKETDFTREARPLLQTLWDIKECLETARKEPYNAQVYHQIKSLIRDVKVDQLAVLENHADSYITETLSLAERLQVIDKYADDRLRSVEEYQKTWSFTLDSLFSRISQLFYDIYSSVTSSAAENNNISELPQGLSIGGVNLNLKGLRLK